MRIRTVLFIVGVVLVWAVPIIARAAEGASFDLPKEIFSQCGLVSSILVAAVIYLAASNAKTRSAWEEDRRTMAASYEKLAVSSAKLEGIVLTLQTRSGGDC